jgi:peptide/nickel transport system substrate-binding protein
MRTMTDEVSRPSRRTRRAVLSVLLSSASVALLAACSGANAPPAAPTTLTTPTVPSAPAAALSATSPAVVATRPAAQPVSGGTLRVSRLGDIARLDGHLTTAADTTWLPFDRLTAYDEKLQPQPMLAESWEISTDFRQIKLNLRKSVQYHSGRELTSDDVRWNLLRVRDPKAGAGALTNQSNWFTSIDTPDKYTVILGSDQPRPMVFDMFEYFNLLDRVSMEGPDAQKTLVGTGPFSFVEWAQGDHLTFTKNKNYWRTSRPYLDTVQVNIAKDQQAAVLQLESGTLDLALSMPLRDYTRLAADAAYQSILVPGVIHVLGVNVLNAPIDNKKVRQALNYAIDRQRFTDSTLLGTVAPLALPWLPGSTADEPAKQRAYAFDPDRAKALLADAGVSNLKFDALYSPSYPELRDFAQVYQADLAKIGVSINIVNLDQAAWLDQVNNRKYNGLYGSLINYATLEPVTIISNSRHYDPSGNNTGFKSDLYSQLFVAAAVEPDTSKRKQIYMQLSDLLLDESFAMPMAPASTRVTARATVHGLATSQHNALLYNDAWISPGTA